MGRTVGRAGAVPELLPGADEKEAPERHHLLPGADEKETPERHHLLPGADEKEAPERHQMALLGLNAETLDLRVLILGYHLRLSGK